MPVDITVLYRPPADPEAFDRHFVETHVPLCLAMPRLVAFEWTRGPIAVRGGEAYHLMARMRYASMADLEASLATPEGQAALADVANFAAADGVVSLTAAVEGAEHGTLLHHRAQAAPSS